MTTTAVYNDILLQSCTNNRYTINSVIHNSRLAISEIENQPLGLRLTIERNFINERFSFPNRKNSNENEIDINNYVTR